jgi:hypothetical protein
MAFRLLVVGSGPDCRVMFCCTVYPFSRRFLATSGLGRYLPGFLQLLPHSADAFQVYRSQDFPLGFGQL